MMAVMEFKAIDVGRVDTSNAAVRALVQIEPDSGEDVKNSKDNDLKHFLSQVIICGDD